MSATPPPTPESDSVSEQDLAHLRRAVELAREALAAGDKPFGTLLVDDRGTVRFEDRNRTSGGDNTRHPELAAARWAAEHLSPAERAASVVYTSGEHCAMCSAAHAWVGLDRIVYAASSEQLASWHREWGVAPGPVATLPIEVVAPRLRVDGPVPALTAEVRALHAALHGVRV